VVSVDIRRVADWEGTVETLTSICLATSRLIDSRTVSGEAMTPVCANARSRWGQSDNESRGENASSHVRVLRLRMREQVTDRLRHKASSYSPYSPSARTTSSAVSVPEKFCWPVTRLPSRTANPRHIPPWT
jgi:hypothetical protein